MAIGTHLDEEFLQLVQRATNDWAVLEPSKTGTYVKYSYRELHGSSTLVT